MLCIAAARHICFADTARCSIEQDRRKNHDVQSSSVRMCKIIEAAHFWRAARSCRSWVLALAF